MNKLLQTTLIAAVLSTSVMASGNYGLPTTIKSGATLIINTDVTINTGPSNNEPMTIDNYGMITTEITAEPYPVMTGVTDAVSSMTSTINNHFGRAVEEENDESIKTTIQGANPIKNELLTGKVCKIVEKEGGKIDENLVNAKQNLEIKEVYDGEIKVSDLKDYGEGDLLYLAAEESGRTARIRGGDKADNYKINCCIGTGGIENDKYYNLDIVGDVWFMNDITNYNKGLIIVKDDGDSKTLFVLQNDVEKELHVPVNVKSGELHVNGNTNIYSEVNISSKASVQFVGKNILESGGTIRIGDKPAVVGE